MRNIEKAKSIVHFGMAVLSSLAFLACLGLTPEANSETTLYAEDQPIPVKMRQARKLLFDQLGGQSLYQTRISPVRKATATPQDDKALLENLVNELTKNIGDTTSKRDAIQEEIRERNQKLKNLTTDIDTNTSDILANEAEQAKQAADPLSDPSALSELQTKNKDLRTSRTKMETDISKLVSSLIDDFNKYIENKRNLSAQEEARDGLEIIKSMMEAANNDSLPSPP